MLIRTINLILLEYAFPKDVRVGTTGDVLLIDRKIDISAQLFYF